MDTASNSSFRFLTLVPMLIASICKRALALCGLVVGLLLVPSSAWAQWSVHDRQIFEQLKAVVTVTVSPLTSSTYTLADLRAMSTNNSRGSFTYAASSLDTHFNPDHTLCGNGGRGLMGGVNPAGIEAINSCNSAKQLTVAMYNLTDLYNSRMVEYGNKIRQLSFLSPATLGEATTLNYQLAYLNSLQQSEMNIYKTQMDLHKSKYDIFKQRQAQAEKHAVYGKTNKTATDLGVQAAIIATSRTLLPNARILP